MARCPRRRRLSLLVLAAVGLWAGLAAEADGQGSATTDRVALEALYDATGGPGWTDNTNWKTSAPLRDWFGVRLNLGRVTSLDLAGNGLTGPIPEALGDLAFLEWLNLGSRSDFTSRQQFKNALTGPIPPALSHLTRLWFLALRENALTGAIPAELGSLANLEHLDLSWNDLTGPIPVELGSLANLEFLGLSWNDLTGPIPR